MELSKKLKDQGWHLTDEGIKKLSNLLDQTTDVRKIISAALDNDFRDIAGGALPTKRDDTIPGRIVLQVQKVRNISAPKANEESKSSPRFLQIELTDGQTTILSLELEPINALNLNLPPGTKIYFSAERLQLLNGYLVLSAKELQVLGGRVEALVEKWELARTMQKYARSGHRVSGANGPPPWIAFGKRTETQKETQPSERNFKSLQAALDKDKDSKENDEFNAMRTEAIAVASKAGAKKVFGGGGQQILDHNVKKILEKGYSEEEANYALRSTHNNLERALYNLKRRQDYKRYDDTQVEVGSKPRRGGSATDMGGRGRGVASIKDEAAAAKPAGNVSLFDFLTDKLPAVTDAVAVTPAASKPTQTNYTNAANKYEKSRTDVTKSKVPQQQTHTNSAEAAPSSRSKFENNISSSFAENRTSAPQRGGAAGRVNERYERPSRDALYPPNERGGYSRFTSGRGRGGRGGGGGARASNSAASTSVNHYEDNASSNRNSTRNSNANQSNRNNRASQERFTAGGVADADYRQHESTGRGSYDKRRGNERSNEHKVYDKRDNAKNYDGNRRQNNNNSNNNTKSTATTTSGGHFNPFKTNNNTNNNNNNNSQQMNQLIESTSKLKLDKQHDEKFEKRPRRQTAQPTQPAKQQQPQQQQEPAKQQQQPQQSSSNQTNQPQFTQHSNQNVHTQLANGYTYDPSKIIGFQSKETNDFALTLLKSQGLSCSSSSSTGNNPLQQMQAPQQTPPPPLLQTPTASYNAAPATTFVLPTSLQQPNMLPSNQFGWLWKTGDLCLAKYWDDGRYYEAEITAVSDKTCVVFFLGYGNHEEVLKSDCLPITDMNHQPINNYMQQQQQQQQVPPNVAAAMSQNNVYQQRGSATRNRYERQMYVPPHKRAN